MCSPSVSGVAIVDGDASVDALVESIESTGDDGDCETWIGLVDVDCVGDPNRSERDAKLIPSPSEIANPDPLGV